MHESPEELEALQGLLDRSAASASAHLREVITDERRVGAAEVTRRLSGMRLLVVATVTADGRPLVGAVDGYLLHGSWYFSSAPDSVRIRHLRSRPVLSATHLPGEDFAVTVHGRGELFAVGDPDRPDLRRAMLDHYLPTQGQAFVDWLDAADAVGVRIHAERMYTFALR